MVPPNGRREGAPTPNTDVLARAVSGDQEALEHLLVLHGPDVRASIAAMIPARWQAVVSAEDMMQQTYIDAFLAVQNLDLRPDTSFRAWLLTLARRNLIDAIRMLEAEKRGNGRVPLSQGNGGDSLGALWELLGSARSTPSRNAAKAEASGALARAVQQLPPVYRRVVELYDLQGRSVEEVAAMLNRSPGAVFMLRARAHRRLQQILGTASLYLSDHT